MRGELRYVATRLGNLMHVDATGTLIIDKPFTKKKEVVLGLGVDQGWLGVDVHQVGSMVPYAVRLSLPSSSTFHLPYHFPPLPPPPSLNSPES
jgi:hypothetical protein